MACPGHAVLSRVIPKTLRTIQSITTKCKQRLSLGRSLGRPCPRRHALGMLSLAGSVPAPCERRTYTRKHNPNIFMQWGWELSQQWSSGEFRQIKVCNQKGQKGSCERSLREGRMYFEWWVCFAHAAGKLGLLLHSHSGACIWEVPVVLQLASGNYHHTSANNMLQS